MLPTQPHIPFTKMQGAGNDFVVINNLEKHFSEDELVELTPDLCNRKYGVGADGLLALFPPDNDQVDYRMFYRNADGSDAGMCGNGARCLALFAHDFGFTEQQTFSVHQKQYEAEVLAPDRVRISFPVQPSVDEFQLDGQPLLQIDTGTEHIVLATEEQALEQDEKLHKEGRRLRNHPAFAPEGTNVNFICGTSNASLRLQTYERGVEGLTLACGTGAIASALAWHHLQEGIPAEQPFEVHTRGGTLHVHFSFDQQTHTYSNLKLEGPAHVVFEGSFYT